MAQPHPPKRTKSLASKHDMKGNPALPSMFPAPSTPPPIPATPRPYIQGFSSPKRRPSSPKYAETSNVRMSGLTAYEEHLLQSILSGHESDDLTLSQFVDQYSKFLPLRVRVSKGFYTDRVAISTDDVYNVHFLKRTKVVTLHDSYSDEYVIPVNSVITFGLIYDCNEHITIFETAADLMDASPLPKLVITQKSFSGKDQKSSVLANEVLVLKVVQRPRFAKGLGRATIDAFSITNNEEKTLHGSCAASFSTNPYLTRLHLPELLKYIPNLSKLEVRMFWDCDDLDILPTHFANVVTISGQTTETSLIATLLSDPTKSEEEALSAEGESEDSEPPVEIPLSLNIEVAVLPPPQNETDQLYTCTKEIYETFHPSRVTVCKEMPMDEMYVTQTQMLAAVREGYEMEGLDLVVPMMAFKRGTIGQSDNQDDGEEYEEVEIVGPPPRITAPSTTMPPPLPPARKPSSPQRTAEPPKIPPRLCQKSASIPESNTTGVHTPPAATSTDVPTVPHVTLASEEDLKSLKQELVRLTQVVQNLSSSYATLQEEMGKLKEEVAKMAERSQSAGGGASEEESLHLLEEANKQGLLALNSEEVLQVLQNLGLKEYQDAFRDYVIDGEVLQELDEDILEHEIGVSKKIHRIKLMKVITGRYSARKILDGEGCYVLFDTYKK